MEFKSVKIQLYGGDFPRQVRRRLAIVRKECDLPRALSTSFNGVDHFAPRQALAVVDFTEVKHLPLGTATIGQTVAFDDAPIAVLFAVLLALVTFEIHCGRNPNKIPKNFKKVGLPHKPPAANQRWKF